MRRPAPREARSHAQFVACDLTLGCTGRVDHLSHDVLGTMARCNRCGERRAITTTDAPPLAAARASARAPKPKSPPTKQRTCRVCRAKYDAITERTTCSSACHSALIARHNRNRVSGKGSWYPERRTA